ncbi:MAG: 30S ribosomal protein S6 [Myxococcota bacterium]
MAKIQTPAHLKREFECVYLIRNDLEDPAVDKLIEKYRAMVGTLGGKVTGLESWGRRKLAYPIEKQRNAFYVQMRYFGSQDMVAEIERSMRMTDEVVRWLTVVMDRQADPEAKPEVTEISRRLEPETETEGHRGEAPRSPSHRTEGAEA